MMDWRRLAWGLWASVEPYGGRDQETGQCMFCGAECNEPHKPDCDFVAASAVFAKDVHDPLREEVEP